MVSSETNCEYFKSFRDVLDHDLQILMEIEQMLGFKVTILGPRHGLKLFPDTIRAVISDKFSNRMLGV